MIDGPGEHRSDLFLIADVSLDRDRFPTASLDPVSNLFGRRWIHDVVDDDIGARCGESERDRATDSGVGTGHQRRLSLQDDRKAEARAQMLTGTRWSGQIGHSHV